MIMRDVLLSTGVEQQLRNVCIYFPVENSELPQFVQGDGPIRVQSMGLPLVLVRAVHVPGF